METLKIEFRRVMLGADPEFFFGKDGEVIGSEKVLPKGGIGNGQIVIDGVQAEFNPIPSSCREGFAGNLRTCFLYLNEQVKEKGVQATFAQTVEVTDKEMSTLSKESRRFGCAPSRNAYKEKNKIAIKDASKYRYRSAGGHLHLGVDNGDMVVWNTLQRHRDVVRLLDIIVGNTCVLIDRDPGNIERRKVYGKAGEYRTPAHGLEYRTLSNFWLRCYPLMSFVTALARFAVNVAYSPEAEKRILACVDMKDIKKAINTNDYDLALSNFKKVKEAISSIHCDWQATYPLQGERVESFEYFAKKGLDHWFKEDPLQHWVSSNLNQGWEHFLDFTVAPALAKAK